MIHHGGTEGAEELERLSGQIIGAAIEVHRALGPGLLESAYQICLGREFRLRRIAFERQRPIPLFYKGLRLDAGYRIDFLVHGSIIVEIKAVETLLPIHRAQLLTYLKLLDLRPGLLINFNVETLIHGLRRILNGF